MAYADFVSYVRKKEEDEEKKRREEAANLLNRSSGSQNSGYQKFVQYVEEKERREDPILAKREQEEYSSWISNLQNFRNNFADEWDSSQSIWKNPSSMEEQRNKIQAEMGPLSVLNSYYSYQLEKNKDAYSSVFGQKETEDLLDAMNRNKEYFKNVDSAVRDREKMFSRFDSQEEYNEALDAQKDYERLSVMDIEAAKKRLEQLEKQLESGAPDLTASDVIESYAIRNRTREGMEEEARNLRKDILNAEEIQSIKAYDEYRNDPEFEKYAQMGAEIENPSFEDAENYWQIGPWKINPPNIGNIVTYSRDNADQLKTGRAFQEDNQGDYRYSFLSEDEVEMYNYLLTKQGEEAANEYLNLLNKNLDSRAAQDIGYNFRNIDNGTIKLLAAAKSAVNSGVLSGIGINDTLSQQAADQIYNELHNPESQLFGRSIGQMGFDALRSAAQMSPSMLVSALTSGAGAPAALSTAAGLVSFGAPIQAKTYQDMLREGYTEEEAARYGALSAISETSLQYILGGISALGGKVSGNLGRKALQSIDNAWLRIVADLGIKMGSEGTEEYLQEILDPVFRNLVLGEDNEIKLFTEDAAYSFLLGSLTAGLMEGGHVTMSDLNLTNVGEAVVDLGRSDDLIYRALQMDTNTESYKLASKIQSGETVGNRKAIGELFATYAQEGGDVSFFTNNAPTHTVNEKAPTAEEASTSETAGQQEITPESTPQNPSAWQNTFTENVPEEIASANIQKIEEVSSTLGKAGSSALKSFYDGTISPDVYYGGFTALYEAGISGRDISRVENERTTQLNRAQKEAAYLAGQSDAEYSLRMEKQNSEKAVFKKAGFIKNEYSANMDRKTIRLYDSMAKSLGVQIQVAAPTGKNGANGWYQNGTIYIAADAENSGFVVAKHEITHRLQELAPAAYRKYRDYAVNAMSEQSGLSVSLVEQYKSRYAESGVRLNTEQAMDEIAADFTEAIVTDPKRFEDLVRQNRSVAEKVLDSIRNFISKIKSAFHRSEDRNNAARETFGVDLNTLEEAERLWSKALEEGSRQAAEKNREKSILSEAKNGILKSGKLSLKRGEKYGRENDESDERTGETNGSGTQRNELPSEKVSGRKTYGGRAKRTGQIGEKIYSSSVDSDGRLSKLDKDYTFGEKPKVGWAAGSIVEPKQGSLTQRSQQTAALYGVPSFVVREDVYNKNYNPDTPAFTYGGQIYFRETLPEDHEASIVFHELVHAMEQNGFRPYLDFLEDTPGRINMSNSFTMVILSEIDSHYKMDTLKLDSSKNNSKKKNIQNLYDDFNAILYGIYQKGEEDFIDQIRDTVDDFGGYMEELTELLDQFKEERTGETKKFSLKRPVEEADSLIALHNLTEEKLQKALTLGGFPMPSIAVTKTDIPHTNFGDITLVMNKSAVDPQKNKRNTVYSADAWTPTFPKIDFEINPETENRAKQTLRGISSGLDSFFIKELEKLMYGMEEYLDRNGGEEGFIQNAMNNYGLKAAYLEDSGIRPKVKTVKREKEKGYQEGRVEKYRDIIRLLGVSNSEEIMKISLNEIRSRYGGGLEKIFPGMTKSNLRMGGILRQAAAYMETSSEGPDYEEVTDASGTIKELDRKIASKAYEEWVRKLFTGIEKSRGVYNGKEIFTPSGNRRSFSQLHYPVELDSIAKAMAAQNNGNSRNVSGFHGVKSLRAGTAERFKNIAGMHKLEGRLQNLSEEQLSAIQDVLNDRMFAIMDRLLEKSPSGLGNDYMQMDSIGNILMEIAENGNYTVDSILHQFNDEYRYHIDVQLAADIRDLLFDVSQMPVNMFEAKPERAVRFDEVLAAVIPDTTDERIKKGLLKNGVRLIEYENRNDADRLAKVNSVEDARFSIKGNNTLRENAALKQENSILRERVEYWKGQTRRTQRVTTDKKAVARAAKELIRTYNSNIPVEDISADLQSLYDYIASGYDGNDELTYSEARRRSDAIAQKLVESATILDDENYRQYRDLRDYFRTTKLSISDTDSHDISDYGSFRRRNFGRIHLSKGNTNIDQVFQEAAAIWPEFFDEQIYSTPSDQLLRIAEVLDGIYSVEERNPFGSYLPETIADASNEIMERFFDLPQTKKTFADRQASRIEETRVKGNRKVQQVREQMNTRLTELRKQSRERIQRAVQRERETRARQMERLKTKYAERDIAGRERRSARELRARIIRHTNDLSKKLLRPTDNQHVPETLRKAVSSMLESINLESLYTIDPATGKRTKNGNGDPVKRTEAFRELRQVYSNITKEGSDYTLVIDPDLMDNLLEIESMKNIPIDSMNTSQLQVIWKAIRGIEASITTANRMLGRSKFERISQVAEGILQDNKDIRPRKNWKGPAGKVGDLIHMDMLTPVSYFHRLGKTGDSLFRMLRDADDEITLHIDEARKAAGKIVGNDAEIIKWEEEKHSFTIEGETFTLTTAQIMTLYELMKRDQAREHLLKGGIRPDSMPSVAREKGRPEPVKLSWNGYKELTDALTEEQKKIGDSLQRYMEKEAAEWGNEASMEVYGYRKFTESGYFPIKTDANQTIRDVANEAHAGTIAGRGFTKQTNPKATNALMVGSIFDVFSEHIQEMAIYSARLAPMENIKRIQNFTFRDENGNRIGTVKSVIERVFGKRGNHYLNTLLDQLNQGVRTDRTEIFSVDALIRNYKAASVALNLRVILQQPTSYMRTWLYLNPLRFWEPFDNKYGGYKMAKKYAPIAIWKDWGYFDINTGRKIKDVLFNTDSFLGKTRNVFMKPAAIADSLTWGRIWNAVAAKVNRENPGLRANNEEFYKKVAEKFNEIIDNTQVVDGILQRSQIMRSGSSLTKMATSFMSEPTKIYNMFANALYDFRHARKEVRGKALKKVGRTAFSLVSSFAITAAVQSIVDAFRDDDKEEDYWYKFLVAYFGNSSNPLENLVEGNFYSNFNPLTYLPYGKDLLSILQGYDVNRMDMETVSKFVSALDIMQKAMAGEGKYTKEYAWINLASETARFLGVPVANLKRDIMAGINHVSIVRDNYLLQYKIEKFIYSPSQSSNRSRFVDILYNAMEKDREAYELIYADMKNSGMDMEKIDSALEKKMKEDTGVTSASDLEKRYVPPEKEEEYNSYLSDLESSSLWGRADDDVKALVKDTAYQIVVESDTGKKAEQKANAAGVDNGTYMLYRLALNVADSDNNGSYTQEEAEAAVRLLQGLSEEEKVGLWQSTNTRWDTEKNPFK